MTFVQLSQGKFITAACRSGTRYCVQRNSQGTWCYSPEAISVTTAAMTSCQGEHVELQGALQSHLNQNLSIAYYNGVDNKWLGGVDYSVPTASGIVRMCLSNSAGDGMLQTLCFNVAGDNSVDGFPFCLVAGGPPVVSDGCYPEKFSVYASATNTPTYYSTARYPTYTYYSNQASPMDIPSVIATMVSVVLGMGIGM